MVNYALIAAMSMFHTPTTPSNYSEREAVALLVVAEAKKTGKSISALMREHNDGKRRS